MGEFDTRKMNASKCAISHHTNFQIRKISYQHEEKRLLHTQLSYSFVYERFTTEKTEMEKEAE